ncbi:MAG TPA: uroporphyrinogen decarboxylase family protein, partial [Candidatus Hydrogenedentes bacterium]|nr:uroporphyrinogen decarboxylase family protein [Candidatus Hydrogenedentota bacterium]
AGGRLLTARTRRDADVNTIWAEEHLLKDEADLRAFLTLPPPVSVGTPDLSGVLEAETALADSGIVMLDTPDPLCLAASLFDLGTYTMIALTDPGLFRALLDWFAPALIQRTEAVSRELPGRLWRVYGPEYAAPPYLPPTLFREFVVPYVAPMITAIQRHGGYARIHSHGRLRDILDDIAAMRPDGLDPIEPPPQGDVELAWVRAHYGTDMVLFGNLEVSDIETLPPNLFRDKVLRALEEGTRTPGRGFVLMPSACPYGRKLTLTALRNYETIIDCAEAL